MPHGRTNPYSKCAPLPPTSISGFTPEQMPLPRFCIEVVCRKMGIFSGAYSVASIAGWHLLTAKTCYSSSSDGAVHEIIWKNQQSPAMLLHDTKITNIG